MLSYALHACVLLVLKELLGASGLRDQGEFPMTGREEFDEYRSFPKHRPAQSMHRSPG